LSRIPHSSLSEFKSLKSPLGIAAMLLLFSVLEQAIVSVLFFFALKCK
jgi:hypothetical protein